MSNMVHYKGYDGSVEFSKEDGVFYGKVVGIQSLISYEGKNEEELLADFYDAVDDYLETCKVQEKEPEISSKSSC